MVRGLFITGTDTEIGKTTLSAALMCRFRGESRLRYWKPIQSGTNTADDTATVARLASCKPEEIFNEGVRLPDPVSPHLAARRAGVEIDIQALSDRIGAEPADTRWIVEGAGGVLVPVSDTDLMIDFMVMLGLPVVIAARSTLGTINHTLLTIEALRARGLRVAGVVMIGPPDEENRLAIEKFARVHVVGEMPKFPSVTPQVVSGWARTDLDAGGLLSHAIQ